MIDSKVLKGVVFQCFEGFLELPVSFSITEVNHSDSM